MWLIKIGGMINHNAIRALVYVFNLISSTAAAIFDAKKMGASGKQRNRNVNNARSALCRPCPFNTLAYLFPYGKS